jgi:pimeloyl-ACP methyl ester carboxylesterase
MTSSNIYYEVNGKGEPLLLLHGLGSCGADWLLQIPAFAEHYQVITPDLPGHGKSPKEPLQIAAIAKTIANLIPNKTDVVGLSFGGFVALQLAIDFPDKVKKLVIAGSSPKVSLNAQKMLVRMLPMPAIAKVISKLCFSNKKYEQARQILEDHIAKMDKETFQALFNAVCDFDITKQASKIHCPVLIIAGKEDALLPPPHSEKLHSLIPGSQLVVLENTGHAIPIEGAAAFNDLVLKFLKD